MTTLRENVETLRNHGRVLKAIFAIADEIDSAEKLEGMVHEAKRRLAATTEELDAKVASSNAALADIDDKIKKSDAKFKALVAKRKAEDAAYVSKAKDEADALVAKAKAKAAAIDAAASDANAKADALVNAKTEELNAKVAELDAANAELASVQAKIDEARAMIKQLIGA